MKISFPISLVLLFQLLFSNHLDAQCWTLSDPKHQSKIHLDPDRTASVYRVSIGDDSTVYIIGSKADSLISDISNEQYLSKSIDGGKTWTRLNSLPQKNYQHFHHINFINRDTGWYHNFDIGITDLYITKNGGESWELCLNKNTITPWYNSYGGHYYDPNNKRFWLTCYKANIGDIGFYISDDLGKSWSFQPLNVSKKYSFDFHVHKNGSGWLPNHYSSIHPDLYKKEAGSYVFKGINTDFGKQTYRFSFKDDYGALIHSNYNSKISMTKDYGETWYFSLSDSLIGYPNKINNQITQFLGVKVLDSLETIAVGYVDTFTNNPFSLTRKPILLKTYDGGKSWRSQQFQGEKNFAFTDVTSFGRDFAVATGDRSKAYIYRRPLPPTCDANSSIDTLFVGSAIKWGAASGCIGGYVLKIGTSPNSGNIVDSLDLWDKTEWTPNVALPFGQPIYVSIRPYNDGGFAPPCSSIKIPTRHCTIETHIDTTLKIGALYNGVVYQNDTLLIEAHKSYLGCDSLLFTKIDIITSTDDLSNGLNAKIKVQPNPSFDNIQINIKHIHTGSSTLLICDAIGQSLQSFAIEGSSYNAMIHTGGLQSGIYFLKLIADNKIIATEKIVIIR